MCKELHQVKESLEKDKALPDNRVLEIKRELEGVKKSMNEEVNQLKTEVENLNSKVQVQLLQVCFIMSFLSNMMRNPR